MKGNIMLLAVAGTDIYIHLFKNNK